MQSVIQQMLTKTCELLLGEIKANKVDRKWRKKYTDNCTGKYKATNKDQVYKWTV